jgi:hypothetical protein
MRSVDFLDLDTIGSVDSDPMLNPDLDPICPKKDTNEEFHVLKGPKASPGVWQSSIGVK